MISNQILQSTIDGLKMISRVDFVVIDTDVNVVAATLEGERDFEPAVADFVKSSADSQEVSKYQFFKIYDEHITEYILVAIGAGEDVYMIGKMAAFQLQSLLVAYKERFDKDNFIKNLLLDNLLLVDIYSRSKKLHIKNEARRIAVIVEAAQSKELNILETVRSFLGANSDDFVTAVDENNVIVVKELKEDNLKEEVEKCATGIMAALSKEGVKDVRVAYGNMVREIKEVHVC